MSPCIIIMYTNISSVSELEAASSCLSSFKQVDQWTVDLDDVDRVMRIVAQDKLQNELRESLEVVGLKVMVMDVFENPSAD